MRHYICICYLFCKYHTNKNFSSRPLEYCHWRRYMQITNGQKTQRNRLRFAISTVSSCWLRRIISTTAPLGYGSMGKVTHVLWIHELPKTNVYNDIINVDVILTNTTVIILAARKQLYEWLSPSVLLPVTNFNYVLIIVSSWNFQELLLMTEVMSMRKVDVRGQRSRSQRSNPNLAVSRP